MMSPEEGSDEILTFEEEEVPNTGFEIGEFIPSDDVIQENAAATEPDPQQPTDEVVVQEDDNDGNIAQFEVNTEDIQANIDDHFGWGYVWNPVRPHACLSRQRHPRAE